MKLNTHYTAWGCTQIKKAISCISILLIICSLVSIAPSIEDSNVKANVSSNGQITYSAYGKEAVVLYNVEISNADINFLAQRFSLIDTLFDDGTSYILSKMLQIKAVNPNVKILGYKDFLGQQPTANDWTEVNKHEDYFAHDANGNRIRNSDWGWYLMDISSLGWRQYLVSYINAHTNNGAYDGVFADDVWTVFWDVYKFDQTVPTSIKTNLKTDMLGLLQYVKSNMLPGKVLFINTDDWTTQNYISASDGMMIEGYGHAAWESLDNPGSQGISNILQQINALSLNSGNGKIVWANSGSTISDFSDYVRINKMIKNCFAYYLLAANGGGAYFGFECNNALSIYKSSAYLSVVQVPIGVPLGSYYTSQNTYMRNFTGGKVVVNLSDSIQTVYLDLSYKLIDGSSVTTLTLNPRNAEIILY